MRPMTQLEIEARLFKAAGQQSKASMWAEIDQLRNDLRERGIPSCHPPKPANNWMVASITIMIFVVSDYFIRMLISER